MLTQLAYKHYGEAVKDVIPALGCHEPVTEGQREHMFGIVPEELFRVHDWRNDVVTVTCFFRLSFLFCCVSLSICFWPHVSRRFLEQKKVRNERDRTGGGLQCVRGVSIGDRLYNTYW